MNERLIPLFKEEGIKKSEMYKTAFLETSALSGDNIGKAFDEIIEQIVQSMTKFMQECVYFGEGEQGWFVFRWLGKVHGHRHMRTTVALFVLPLFLVTGHPST